VVDQSWPRLPALYGLVQGFKGQSRIIGLVWYFHTTRTTFVNKTKVLKLTYPITFIYKNRDRFCDQTFFGTDFIQKGWGVSRPDCHFP
jgi:hypothetical protein